MRKLLYIDSSYTLTQLRAQGLEHVLRIRFLDGFFDRVWSAHPVDTHPSRDPDIPVTGAAVFERLSDDHVFVRGRYGRYPVLTRISSLNAVLALWSFVRELINLVRREGITVIRAGDPLFCGFIGLIVARRTGARLVVRVSADHDMIRTNTGSPVMPALYRFAAVENWIERLVLSRADLVFVPSKKYSDFAIRKGTHPDRLTLIRYGNLLDSQHLTEPAERGKVEAPATVEALRARPWMVYVGRLLQLKYAEDCYEVLLELASQDNKVGLLLIGDGHLRATISARARADGLTERVWFMGNIDQDSIARILPRCMLALSPLTGRALAEVAFAALPIVAYDLDWQGELVETNVTGILVPAGDIAAMARGAGRLLGDPALRRKFGGEARQRALNLLEPQEQTRREIEAYQRLG